MLKRFLFVLLLLGFVISVPYEVSAATKKETSKERRERRRREREEKRKQRQQKNTQQSKHPQKKKQSSKQDTQPAKQPQPKKIIPTFEEKLTPAQVNRKIQTIRKRIETAPENIISNKDKPFLLEIFDDIAQTQMGRYIFEKTHPDLMFCVKPMGSPASYAFGPKCINLDKNYFKENQTPEEWCKKRLYLSQSIAHEATHAIQHVNDMMNCGKISFEERITITKICELHALLNESITSYQLSKQPHYKAAVKAGKTEIVPGTRFYAELFDAYKTTGLSDAKAAKAARTKFVETFWQNNGEKSIQIGEKTVFPCEEFIQNWNISYSTFAFRELQGNKTPYREAMRHRGIERFLRQFTQSMDIDTPPSFFRNPQTTAFHMPTSKRLLTYANGILNTEMDALTTGMITKGYRSGIRAKGRKKGEPYYILIKTLHPQIASQDRSHTEYHEGTNIKRATYTYKNGKMNGIYREYDLQGRQIMEVPVQNDNVNGEGWVMENGKKVLKTFFHKALLRNRKQ
ncbi:MAG: hypothetical protein E7057_03140 [Lentisphaerae bacterium]|nr:hypothetical protein [Lentisphaerota bacterium]